MKKAEIKMKISSPVARVWDALVLPETLQKWLAEKAEVELIPEGKFEIISGTPYVTGAHVVKSFIPLKELKLVWRYLGEPNHATIELHPHSDQTLVNVTHISSGNESYRVDDCFGGECGTFQEMWCYNLGLLKTYLETGEAACRLDSKRSPAKAVSHTLRLRSSPEEVFEALVDPKKIKGWNSFSEPKVGRRKGGRYSFGWTSEEIGKDGPGEIVEYQEGKKISYTWHGEKQTLVTWEVEPIGDDSKFKTRLKLVHSGFIQDQNMLVEWNLGWAAFLQQFLSFVDHGEVAMRPTEFEHSVVQEEVL